MQPAFLRLTTAFEERGAGVKQRTYARVFIVGSTEKEDDRVVYITLDTCFGDTAVRRGLLEALAADSQLKRYKAKHIALTGVHSHSGPGGYSNYLLHQASVLGFHKDNYKATVDGTVHAIRQAHSSLSEGTLTLGTAHVKDGNINRSPFAYAANPKAERDKYVSEGNTTDTLMTLLRFTKQGKHVGALSWYAVHGTSAHKNNTMVTGDNKGVAAYLMEQAYGGDFVAGFSQANVGDVSPNVLGQWCEDGSNQPCDAKTGTCPDGSVLKCQGRGPKFTVKDNGLSSAYEMGKRQWNTAKSIMDSLDSKGTPIKGKSVKTFHFKQDMRGFSFRHPNGKDTVKTCASAFGFSFGAGTSDGPGLGDFQQSATNAQPQNPFWKLVSLILKNPSDEQKKCQGVKPILADVGEMDVPYAWGPNHVDVQMARVGQLVMIIAPGEATTMAGRRWRAAVKAAAQPVLGQEPVVVLGGPSNGYTHYITTEEEYQVQRYEGASTLFGPHTLNAHINLTVSKIAYLSPSSSSDPAPGPDEPDTRDKALTLMTPVLFDNPPLFQSFGKVLQQPAASVRVGSTVSARFVGANPRNNLRLEGTFAAVEKMVDGKWIRVRSDRDWFLQYEWKRTSLLLGQSEVTISWQTGTDDGTQPGTYRLKYYGDSKAALNGAITAFEGTSNEFKVTAT